MCFLMTSLSDVNEKGYSAISLRLCLLFSEEHCQHNFICQLSINNSVQDSTFKIVLFI